MTTTKNLGLAVSANGINYYVICSDETTTRPYGVLAETEADKDDAEIAENLFFTKEEAQHCCLWLAENQVFPITLCEVLQNFYR